MGCKKIQPVHPKGNQSWIFIGRTDAEAEAPILWPPDVKSWLTGKDPDAGKDWRQEEKGTTEDEMVGWHHQLDGRVWVHSRSWWVTGKPGVLQSTGLQRVRHDWGTELNWITPECVKNIYSRKAKLSVKISLRFWSYYTIFPSDFSWGLKII